VAFFWLILPPLAGIIVIVAAAFDSAEARSLGERGRPLVAGERLLLAGVVLAAAPRRLSIRLRRAAVGILAGAETLPPLGGHLKSSAGASS
jgi:hypothetical protein